MPTRLRARYLALLALVLAVLVFSAEAATSSFAFITDLHYGGHASIERTLDVLARVQQEEDLAFVALGGDHILDGHRDEVLRHYRNLWAHLTQVMPGVRIFPVKGNHDDATYYNILHTPKVMQYISPAELREIFFPSGSPAAKAVAPGDTLYYLYDEPSARIRYIFLDTVDIPYTLKNGKLKYQGMRTSAFSAAQLEWIASTALDLEVGWAVVFIGHIPPVPALNNMEKIINAEVFHGIVKAFQEGAVYQPRRTKGDFAQGVGADFRERGPGEVMAYFHGHRHDDISAFRDGILYIGTQCARSGLGIGPGASALIDGTEQESAFDVITIDREQGWIYATRHGAGHDRMLPILPSPIKEANNSFLVSADPKRTTMDLQLCLIERGYLQEGEADGILGQKTRDAIQRFQKDNRIAADGFADELTKTLLEQHCVLREEAALRP